MSILWLDEVESDQLSGKNVLCRVDFNVPIDTEGNILDAQRIELAIPSIRKLLRANAKVVIISHLGRPKAKVRPALSLQPVADYLRDLLNQEVIFVHDCVGDGVSRIISNAPPASLIMLENLRFHGGEEKNDPVFAKMLARGMDFYIDDAFGAVHRAHASTVGVAKFFEKPMGGLLLKKELKAFDKLLYHADRPFVAIVGGAKVSSKIGVLTQLVKKVDALIIGGAMAYTFLKAQGFEVGVSMVENDKLMQASNLLRKAQELGVKIYLPTDHVVARAQDQSDIKVVASGEFAPTQAGFDIGPQSRAEFCGVIKRAETVFLNGPLGMCEVEAFSHGTAEIMNALAHTQGYTVVGGGDSIAALKHAGLVEKIDFVSSGGGAALELLEGKVLPGLEALGFY
ncbi:MAG: phosphoglycerate kinase [Myxococcales bacterium]|nr:phosphoglycerate kinase [Myxococcales bacterium]USN50606.1 MAG: phosphoglycerate kinase [Myxococcales bacterium]